MLALDKSSVQVAADGLKPVKKKTDQYERSKLGAVGKCREEKNSWRRLIYPLSKESACFCFNYKTLPK